MNREELISAVEQYIQDDSEKYAIMINGPWGCGKTFLYEKYLYEAIEDLGLRMSIPKTNVYLSLYGISSVEALSKQVFSEFTVLSKMDIHAKHFTLKTAGIIAAIAKSFTITSPWCSMELGTAVEGILDSIELNNLIICFDDLERCNIPINELFGYINILVEQCGCKVIILADEYNIGKIYSNTNVEEKYRTILSGNRVVIPNIKNEEATSIRADRQKEGRFTINEIKALSEMLYGDNYIYHDIKEKVIGRTYKYTLSLPQLLTELIEGNSKTKGVITDETYKGFLQKNTGRIIESFQNARCNNVRIVKSWIIMFKDIFVKTNKYFNSSDYYDAIVDEFIRYSILVFVSYKTGKEMLSIKRLNNKAYDYPFIDKYIVSNNLLDGELVTSAREIEKRSNQDNMIYGIGSDSTQRGKAIVSIMQWTNMKDEEVKSCLADALKEVDTGLLTFDDCFGVLSVLSKLEQEGLFEGSIVDVQKKMLSHIENDKRFVDIRHYSMLYKSENTELQELFSELVQKRLEQNIISDRSRVDEQNIYKSSTQFVEKCEDMKEFFYIRRSFMQYIDKRQLIDLINRSDLKGIYDIADTFRRVYKYINSDGIKNDAQSLNELLDEFDNGSFVEDEITRKIAITYLKETIEKCAKYEDGVIVI